MSSQRTQCATCGSWVDVEEVFRVPYDPDVSGLMFCSERCMLLGIQKTPADGLRAKREPVFPPQYASDLLA